MLLYVDVRTQRSLLQAIQYDIVYLLKCVLWVVISDRCFSDAGPQQSGHPRV